MNTQMKQLYNDLLVNLNSTKFVAQNVLNNYKQLSDTETEDYNDELKVYEYIEGVVIENLKQFIWNIENSLKESIESYLIYDSKSGRFKLASWDEGDTLSCGSPIELLNNEWELNKNEFRWHSGRVEHSNNYGGYYFFNNDGDHVPLKEGMKVRIRVR